MMRRILLGTLCLVLLSGFQVSELRWPTPATLVLRFLNSGGMPAGMQASAVAAAQLWRSPSLEIRLVDEQYGGQVNGTIRYGGAMALGHGIMGTMLRMGKSSGQLTGCDIEIADTPVPWHTGMEPPGAGQSDAITAFAHEMGHCIGLLHEDGATPPALMRAAIHYGEYHRRLPADDAMARDHLFPIEYHSGFLGCGKR